MVNYKQVILVRQDLKLPKGKLSAQVAHASVYALLKTPKKMIDEWRAQGMGKIVLKVKDEAELREYRQLADQKGLVTALITDAGKTILAPGTVTCLGIGPDDESIIDKVTGNLKMV